MDFVPVRTRTIIPDRKISFDLYVKVSEKYLLYIRNGDDIDHKRIDKLKAKKVRQLFINGSDEENYQKFLDQSLMDAADDPNLSSKGRADIAAGVASSAVEDVFENPEDESAFQMLERAAQGLIKIVGKKSDVLRDLYKSVHDSNAELHFKNAVSTGALATCFGEFYKLPEDDVKDIGVAAMLLDVGILKMGEEFQTLFSKPFENFTNEENVKYREHPDLSVQVLGGKDYINKRIIELVHTHEERKSGAGFPQGLSKLDRGQEIVGICSTYDRMVTCLGMGHGEVIEDIRINQIGNFDLELIKDFQRMILDQGLS